MCLVLFCIGMYCGSDSWVGQAELAKSRKDLEDAEAVLVRGPERKREREWERVGERGRGRG